MKKTSAIIWASVSTAPQATEDKDSLPSQEAEARALAARNGWDVLEVLSVTGHSRRYIDIHECNRDMLAENINAFDRLMWHWKNTRNFILIVRDASRFARTQSLHATVVETTIDRGSRIYSLSDGMVDEENYRMWIAMGGYSAAGEVDRLVKGRKRAMKKRAEQGLPTTSSVLTSHTLVRDPHNFKPQQLVVNEDLRRMWNDVAALLLEGVGWHKLGIALYERFGHVNPHSGKMFSRARLYQILMSPTFWGNSGQNIKFIKGLHAMSGMWRIEPGHAIPEGVVIHYGTHDPVYTGEQAAMVIAEIKRRTLRLHNRRAEETVYDLTGVFVCDECNYAFLSVGQKPGKPLHRWWRCGTRWALRNNERMACSQKLSLRDDRAREKINELLIHLREEGDTKVFQNAPVNTSVDDIQRDIDAVTTQLQRLILDKVKAPDAALTIYDDLIEQASERLSILKTVLADVQNEQARHDEQPRRDAIRELKTLDLNDFWQRDPRWINQFFHRLLGDYRFAVRDGQIIGLKKRMPHHAAVKAQAKKK